MKTLERVFEQHSLDFYGDLQDLDINYSAVKQALKGYYTLKHQGRLDNTQYLSIVDFSRPSTEERLYIIDMDNCCLYYKGYVAHGRNTGELYANDFSNRPQTNKSSLGFYKTAELYSGRNGLSMRLDGLEQNFNSNARNRAIVLHGADYVSEQWITENGHLGRSRGCPAIEMSHVPKIVDRIKNGSCMFIYKDYQYYERESFYLNNMLYLRSLAMLSDL
ncbi:MAG: murein L,D-transpeptidase catalytic domain family protein [Bacteroidia bacterium]|nr:murein L,D-transpeptidase catalytic domain family protein [Bacteroidia bacterium]